MSDITANVVVSNPRPIFTDSRTFRAVANGRIYIGQIDTDPFNPANQIPVYIENEDGSHVQVAQPLIINAAGKIVYNGQLVKIVTVQGHSMAIYDAYGSQVDYIANVLKYDHDQFSIYAKSAFRYEVYYRMFGQTFDTGATITERKQVLLNSDDGYWYRYNGTLPVSVPPNSSPDSSWSAVGYLNGYDIGDVRNWSNNLSDIALNDVNLQKMVDELGEGAEIIFPYGTTTKFTRIWIKKQNVTVIGSGVIDGTIRVCRDTFLTSSDIYMNTKISGVSFITDRAITSAIELAYARMGNISDIKDVRGYKNFIHIIPSTTVGGSSATAWGQMVNRWIVSECHYGKGAEDGESVDRFIFSEPSPGMQYPMADWIVRGNEGHATVDHIYIDTIDGLTVSDNIQFFPGGVLKSNEKNSHIRIVNGGGWINIHDNKFFESGGTSIYLNKCTRFTIHDNLYAFGSQRIPVPQIVIDGSPLSGDYFTQSSIHDETIIMPGGEGITVLAKNGRVKIHSCNIQDPSSATYYYGSDPQPTPQGVVINQDTIAIEVYDNTVRNGDNTLPITDTNIYSNNVTDKVTAGNGLVVDTVMRTLNITSASSTIDVSQWDIINVSVSSHFDVVGFVNSASMKNVTLTNGGSSNFTIIHSSNLKLAGAVPAVITPGSSIEIRVNNGGIGSETGRAII